MNVYNVIYFLSQVLHILLFFCSKVPGLSEKKMDHFLEMNWNKQQ